VSSTAAATVAPTKSHPLDDKVAEAIRNTLLQRHGTLKPTAPVAAPKAPVIEKKATVCGVNQRMASDLLGVKLKKDEDFPVTILDKASLPVQVAAFVPFPDPDYKVQVEEACKLLRAWEEGDKVMVYGPTGSGKSSLIRLCAAHTNRPFIRINMTGDTESSTLFGSMVVRGGATVWEDGPVTEAVKYGAALLIDEWELMGPEIAMGLQWLIEDDGKLYLKEMPGTSTDKMIQPHRDFRVVFAGNTVGQGDDTGSHAGVNPQNTATVDRFQTIIRLGYLDTAHEIAVLTKKCLKLDPSIADKMVKVAALVRQANAQGNIALTMSPRTLINWGRKIFVWGDPKIAFTIAFLDKLRDTDRKVVLELYGKVFGR
jgi:cobaltochelatase CobS